MKAESVSNPGHMTDDTPFKHSIRSPRDHLFPFPVTDDWYYVTTRADSQII